MAVWTTIQRKDIEYSRIDGEFYQPKYLDELKIWDSVALKFTVSKLLKCISKPVRTGKTPKDRIIKDSDSLIPFIKTDTLREGVIDFSRMQYLPMRSVQSSDIIEKYSSIVTIIGATKEIVGRVAIIDDDIPDSTTNQNVAVINFNDLIDPYFGMAYLQSKYGRDQLWRHSRQTEQVNLNCREVERILIPIPPNEIQKRIGDLVRECFQQQKLSKDLYTQANQLLEDALGLNNIEFKKEKSYTASFSEVVTRNRFDGEHFQPKYIQIKELIRNYADGWEPLLLNVKYQKPNIDPHKSPNTFFSYIELSDINPSLGVVNDIELIKGIETPSRARRKVESGDVIASSVVGSVDKAAIISDAENGFLASTGFFHFRSLHYTPEFLLLLVKSTFFKEQLFQESTGGILSAVPESNLLHIILPKYSDKIQEQATKLVRQSHAAYRESKSLLEQAKQEVETLIEQAAQTA